MKLRLLALFVVAFTEPAFAAQPATFIELPWRYVIGGRSGGRWLASEAAGKALEPGTKFRLFTLRGEKGAVIAHRAAPDADVCPDVWLVTLNTETEDASLGVAAPWNPMPRAVKIADTTQDAYVKAVTETLAAKGIRKPRVKITQHLRVDLDGDGEEEVLIAATHYAKADAEGSAPTEVRAGDYSFVALRRVLGGKVITQILDGEFHPASREDAAPNVHAVSGILDLDGDGKMEVILHSAYYEGGGTTVWQFGPKKAAKVLEMGCGV